MAGPVAILTIDALIYNQQIKQLAIALLKRLVKFTLRTPKMSIFAEERVFFADPEYNPLGA